MTDRDEFAKAAMQGLISSEDGIKKLRMATNMLLAEGNALEGTDVVAMVAYELADAMLRCRDATEAKPAKASTSVPLKRSNRTSPLVITEGTKRG